MLKRQVAAKCYYGWLDSLLGGMTMEAQRLPGCSETIGVLKMVYAIVP